MNWQDSFKEGKEIVLATCSNECQPNANIVISLGIVDGKLLVANCQMVTTFNNLKENRNVCVVGGHYRIKGKVNISDSGKYFDLCVEKSNGYDVQSAILIGVSEVFDLDKTETVKV